VVVSIRRQVLDCAVLWAGRSYERHVCVRAGQWRVAAGSDESSEEALEDFEEDHEGVSSSYYSCWCGLEWFVVRGIPSEGGLTEGVGCGVRV